MTAGHVYFSGIASYSRDLMDRLPIAEQTEPLADTFNRLGAALGRWKPAELSYLRALVRPRPDYHEDTAPAGMNTIGILADRLAILVCKEWYLRHRQRRPWDADVIGREQTPDIVTALSLARPGHAKLLEKVGPRLTDATACDFEEAYFGLLAANILMWETQEMLYTRDMASVAATELRDYITFFSQANMTRNAFITQCESLYWHDITETALPGNERCAFL